MKSKIKEIFSVSLNLLIILEPFGILNAKVMTPSLESGSYCILASFSFLSISYICCIIFFSYSISSYILSFSISYCLFISTSY